MKLLSLAVLFLGSGISSSMVGANGNVPDENIPEENEHPKRSLRIDNGEDVKERYGWFVSWTVRKKELPSSAPSMAPSLEPSDAPSNAPSTPPSTTPSMEPSKPPTESPTLTPSVESSKAPSATPTTSEPTTSPTLNFCPEAVELTGTFNGKETDYCYRIELTKNGRVVFDENNRGCNNYINFDSESRAVAVRQADKDGYIYEGDWKIEVTVEYDDTLNKPTLELQGQVAAKTCTATLTLPACTVRPYNVYRRDLEVERLLPQSESESSTLEPWTDHLCGGVLISPTEVLTAAHCFDLVYENNTRIDEITLEDYDIMLNIGALNKPFKPRENVVFRWGVSINKHPNYDPRNFNLDFAIIELNEPVTIVEPAEIDLRGESNDLKEGDKLSIIGFGENAENVEPTILQKASVQYVDRDTCFRQWTDEYKANHVILSSPAITDKMICTTDIPEKRSDACFGDSGGPLIWEKDNRQIVLGITSHIDGICGPNDRVDILNPIPIVVDNFRRLSFIPNLPSVFGKISGAASFIDPSFPIVNTLAPTSSPTASSQPTNNGLRIVCGFQRTTRDSTGDITDTPILSCGTIGDPLIVSYADEPEGRILMNSNFAYDVADENEGIVDVSMTVLSNEIELGGFPQAEFVENYQRGKLNIPDLFISPFTCNLDDGEEYRCDTEKDVGTRIYEVEVQATNAEGDVDTSSCYIVNVPEFGKDEVPRRGTSKQSRNRVRNLKKRRISTAESKGKGTGTMSPAPSAHLDLKEELARSKKRIVVARFNHKFDPTLERDPILRNVTQFPTPAPSPQGKGEGKGTNTRNLAGVNTNGKVVFIDEGE